MLIHGGGPQFARYSDSYSGGHITVGPSTFGANFTAAANNADGTAVAVLSALAHDAHYLVFAFEGTGLSTVGTNGMLADILIDPAGGTTWAEFISDLSIGQTLIQSNAGGGWFFFRFPLWVPSGASLGIQARTEHTSDITTGNIIMWAYGEPKRPDLWWCGQKVEGLGTTAATSRSTPVTGGTSGTPAWGSWTTIGTSTQRYGSIQLGNSGERASQGNRGYYVQLGAGSQPLPGLPVMASWTNTGEQHLGELLNMEPNFCDIPASTVIQARTAFDNSAAAVTELAVYGVY